MKGNSSDNVENDRLRIQHAFWLSVFGLSLAAALTVLLVNRDEMKVTTSAEAVAIVGLFTSVTGTLVGAFFGLQIGSVAAEHERRSRQKAEERRQSAEEVTRTVLAHLNLTNLDPEMAKKLVSDLREHEKSE